MEPHDDLPRDLVPRQARPLAGNPSPALDDTRAVPRIAVAAPVIAARGSRIPTQVAGLLLPSEHVTLVSSPHPFVFVGPAVRTAGILVAGVVLLNWKMWLVINGHHALVPFLNGPARIATLGLGGLALLRECITVARQAARYLAFRVVSTNRRVFVIDGFFGRSVTPLGNTALAGSTMSQSLLGRMFGFGTITLAQNESVARRIPTMSQPVELYRHFGAVANGVDGDTWTPAVRQTIIP